MVTEANVDGAKIAGWMCNMHFAGTIWQSTGVIVLLPNGFFTCPNPPQRHWYLPG